MSLAQTTPAPLPLNQGQQDAADAFFQFLFSDQKEFIISGPGGVGKTHLMGNLIDVVMPRYIDTCKMMGIPVEFETVEMTATTNKAAEALSLATGRPADTVHKFLNLKVTDDHATGVSKLTRQTGWHPHERKILFIDESSMIDRALFDETHAALLNCKIVYVGDHCQLAPVKEKLSPIYRKGIPFYELTEPMRTKIPELQALNNQLRHTVETGEFSPIQVAPGIIDWLDDDQMQAELANTFAQQTHNSRILAYTNRRVVEFNNFIRQVRQLPDEWTNGEFLINNNAIRVGGRSGRMLSVEEEVEIIAQSGTTLQEVIEVPSDGDPVMLEIRRTTLRSRLGETFHDVPLPVDRNHYDALVKYYQQQGKHGKGWKRYFDLKNTYPDLRPRDAGTVYKAQGSTYDTVFIDVGDISTCNNPAQVARMLYVGGSRPRTRVFFYGDLAPKYGGLVR